MANKVISADEAIALIRDNDVVTTTGFVQSCIPEALHAALECLGEVMWLAQRNQSAPDQQAYLEGLRRR